MRVERVVINASPLITLFRAGLHPLLPELFPDLVVPDAVWAEVVNRTHADPAALACRRQPGRKSWQPLSARMSLNGVLAPGKQPFSLTPWTIATTRPSLMTVKHDDAPVF